jgi:hypothetical protein
MQKKSDCCQSCRRQSASGRLIGGQVIKNWNGGMLEYWKTGSWYTALFRHATIPLFHVRGRN